MDRFTWNLRRTMGLLPIFLALSGCFPDWDVTDSAVVPANADTRAPGAVTIATYNVENFNLGGDAPGQYDNIAAFVAKEAIDILALQEVQKDANGDDEALFSAALDAASYPMSYNGFSSMSDGFNALAVWSRYPLFDFEEILPENTRTVFRFRAEINGTSVLFFVCHLKSGDDPASAAIRLDEAARIGAYVQAHTDIHSQRIVILGDMNTGADADFAEGGTLDRLTLEAEADADRLVAVTQETMGDTATYPASGSLLDHILLSRPLRDDYASCSVEVPHPAGDGPYGPSDHYPVLLRPGV